MALNGLPGLAEVAMQSGRHAAKTIVRRLRGRATEGRSAIVDLGTMATIARFRAVATIGRLQLAGFVGWLLWLVVHLAFLTGFKNRAGRAGQLDRRVPRPRPTPAHHHQAAGARARARGSRRQNATTSHAQTTSLEKTGAR